MKSRDHLIRILFKPFRATCFESWLVNQCRKKGAYARFMRRLNWLIF